MRKHAALFFLIMFMIGTDTFLISPLLPTLQEQFGVPTGAAGWMIGSYTLGSAVFALIAGPLSDGWNRKLVLLGGLAGFSISTALCGLASSFWMMCLFRVLAGVSAAFTAPQVWASIPAVMPPDRIPRAMGLAFSGLAAAQALGVPIGSWLAASSWHVPFWTIGASSAFLLAAAYVLLPDIRSAGSAPERRTSILSRYIPLIASGKARSGFLGYLLLHLGSGAAMAFVGKWMADDFALPVGRIGNVMMFLGFGSLLGSLVSPFFARKLGRTGAAAAGMAAVAILYAATPVLTRLPLATAVYLIVFTVLGVVFPIIMEALTALNARIRGTISSLANATMNAANTLGAWIAGLLYVRFDGFPSIGLFSAVCLVLALGTFRLGGILRTQKEGVPRTEPTRELQ
jgi:predicted MFS family arabinose efflux permease